MTNWRAKERKKIDELKLYATALEQRELKLIDALADLAQGFGIKTDGSWDQSMKKLAANKLAQVAKMRVPPRPYL